MKGDYPTPEYKKNPKETDRIYAENLDSVYCNAGHGRNAFKGKARDNLRIWLSEICPYYPQLKDGSEAPHNYYQQIKDKKRADAFVNLRHWTQHRLPVQVIWAVQVELQQVCCNCLCEQLLARFGICLGFDFFLLLFSLFFFCLVSLFFLSGWLRDTA